MTLEISRSVADKVGMGKLSHTEVCPFDKNRLLSKSRINQLDRDLRVFNSTTFKGF